MRKRLFGALTFVGLIFGTILFLQTDKDLLELCQNSFLLASLALVLWIIWIELVFFHAGAKLLGRRELDGFLNHLALWVLAPIGWVSVVLIWVGNLNYLSSNFILGLLLTFMPEVLGLVIVYTKDLYE